MTELENSVLEWLESSGYALELEVTRAFRGAGCETSSGEFARDQTSGKLRELDCVAEHNTGMILSEEVARAYFCRAISVVECKTGRKPWVVFADRLDDAPDDDEGIVPQEIISNEWGAAALWLFFFAGLAGDEAIFRQGPHRCYGGVSALKKPNDDNIDEFYRAISQCVAGAVALAGRKEPGEGYDRHDAKVVFPVVVTASPLLKASTNAEGHLEVSTINHARLRWCGAETRTLWAPYVDIITRDAVDDFAKARSAETKKLATAFKQQILKLVKALSLKSLEPLKLEEAVLRRARDQGHIPSLVQDHPSLASAWEKLGTTATQVPGTP